MMSFHAICRLCLVTESRFFTIINTPLQDVFMKLTNISITAEVNKPTTVCTLCHTYLRRFAILSQKALKAEEILNGFINTNVLITPQAVEQINRQSYNLTHSLSISPTEYINVEKLPTNIPSDNENKHDLVGLAVKDEFVDELVGLAVKDESVKEINKFDDTLSDNHNSSSRPSDSEDDVPLKSISIKKQLQNKVVRRRNRSSSRKKKEDCISEYAREIILTKDEQIAELNERAKSLNYLNSPLKCTLCYKGFVDGTAYFHHMEKHSEKSGPHECGVCRARYPTARQLRAHAAAAHARRYACRRCAAPAAPAAPHTSRTAHQAREHEKWHRGHTYECKLCAQKFRKPTSHLTHMRKRHPTAHACVLCGDSFATAHGLLMHKSKTHVRDQPKESPEEPASKRYCEECGIQFVALDAWKRHVLTSTKHIKDSENSSHCRICDKTFSSNSELTLHLKGHEKALKASRAAPVPIGAVPDLPCAEVACDQCGARFVNRSKLQAHVKRIHLGLKYNKNIVCEVCGKHCTSNASLKYHQRTHTGERPYQCATCSKRFSDSNQLRIHTRTHTGERPYCCAACGKRFSQKPALNRHYRVHTGVKPYTCQYCLKTFSQSNSLKLHVNTVHLKGSKGGKRSLPRPVADTQHTENVHVAHSDVVRQ